MEPCGTPMLIFLFTGTVRFGHLSLVGRREGVTVYGRGQRMKVMDRGRGVLTVKQSLVDRGPLDPGPSDSRPFGNTSPQQTFPVQGQRTYRVVQERSLSIRWINCLERQKCEQTHLQAMATRLTKRFHQGQMENRNVMEIYHVWLSKSFYITLSSSEGDSYYDVRCDNTP